ncbi:glycosyltransferase [Defluviimonas sp. WL0024]|uniref:Glycosyltransferase n=1 Tax=Albidovulum salinarum TaxID=2984153 RepID=A0ABT2X0S4_9RHOB|nr:glycosyltransferase [Defluviimonas sp. WL0024]MCU9847521.1 glycosyltransferase [Defluviimonas sp. WL0024]
MATRILDIGIAEAGGEWTGLDGYDRALFLIRLGARPLGMVTVPVRDGAVARGTVHRAIGPAIRRELAVELARRSHFSPPQGSVRSATIAICTRDRPDDLSRALAALTSFADLGQEILVVDNCPSTEATRQLVAGFPSVRYVLEPVKGLDNARNRALTEARGEVVAFIDDDAVAEAGWLDALLRGFEDPRVACVTGLTMPLELETEAQEVFEALAGFSRRGFARRTFSSPPTHPLATGGIGAGANMAIRRDLLHSIGPFDPALDAGTPTKSGGDHEYMTRILRAGHHIVYEPGAVNWHRHRRSWEELVATMQGYGVGVYAGWTRAFLVDHDWGVFRRALGWFRHEQLPALVRATFAPSKDRPRDLLWAELRGCWQGPFAYLRARRQAAGGATLD